MSDPIRGLSNTFTELLHSCGNDYRFAYRKACELLDANSADRIELLEENEALRRKVAEQVEVIERMKRFMSGRGEK